MMKKHTLFLMVVNLLVACSAPVDAPPPPTSIFTDSPPQAVSTPTPFPATSTPEVIPASPTVPPLDGIPAYLTSVPESFTPEFCKDTRALQLLSDLQTAIQNKDGELLASLVSPSSGVGVRFIRNGSVITYFDNIKFVFETTYEADWGLGAGSGLPVKGSFQDIVLPSLETVFSSNPILACNELITGGATYVPEWQYQGMDFYSVHFPGTDEFGGMNWETWAVGMVPEQGKPMLAALGHFVWEP
jgi:hypothetical protein